MTKQRDTTLIVAFTVFALLLRLWSINSDLWLDEIITLVKYMRLSPFEAATTFHAANQHVLNSFLGSISIHLLGEATWTVRLPALCFGVATIPVFFCLARAVTERREAIFATLFMTLSYHQVWFSQNARGYSAMVFFTVLSTLLLVRWLDNRAEPGRRDWLWFSLCGGLGMLSLLNYAFVLVGQFLAALFDFGSKREWNLVRLLIGCGVLVVAFTLLGYSATLPAMIKYFTFGGPSAGWQEPAEFAKVTASGMSGGLAVEKSVAVLPYLAVGAAGVITLVGWVSYLRSRSLVAMMLVVPVVANIIVLEILNWGAYPRSFLYIMPFGILIAIRGAFVLGGWAVRRLRIDERAAWILPVLLLAGAAVTLSYNYRYPKVDYTGSLAYARTQAAPEDIIAVVGYLAYGFREYHAPDLAFPRSVEDLRALRGPEHRVWVLYSFTRDLRRGTPDLNDYVGAEFQHQRKFKGTLGDGDVYLKVSEPLDR